MTRIKLIITKQQMKFRGKNHNILDIIPDLVITV
jgi:hypothetical protein